MSALLEVDHLAVQLPIDGIQQPVLHDVSFSLKRGEVLAVVGESGSGKSMTARAIVGLLPPGATTSGRILFEGTDMGRATRRQRRDIRARRIGMIFQDPRAAINPIHRIGDFLTEALVREHGVGERQARTRAASVLDEVGIDEPHRRLRQYPHELSGGMLQRVMIASVLLAEPDLILADEPTTALDVTTQAEVIALLDGLRSVRELAMLFITHDLELAATISDRIAVMYAGYLVETLPSAQALERPVHPYTEALLRSRPLLRERMPEIPQIPGRPLAAYEAPSGCPFHPRCSYAQERCKAELPPPVSASSEQVMCLRADERRAQLGRATLIAEGPGS
ncbi:MAG: ABC transporter ATP-binding protein [Solirubrobacteraceae bacterium]